MTPTEELVHEHKVILHVLDAAERETERIEEAGNVDIAKVEQILDFIRDFADRCHHGKEEGALFRAMERRGMAAESGPLAFMLHEHEIGRERVRLISEVLPQAAKGDPQAVAAVRDNLLAYVRLLRDHIDKEDNLLYPMADRLLTPEDQEELEKEFARVESEEMGAGTHEKYHDLAHKLAA
jgi:hemerythrin-like domain-containing protein